MLACVNCVSRLVPGQRTAAAVPLLFLAAGILALGACASRRPAATATSLWPGDTMHGRVAPGQEQQQFAIEGVESSLLDFKLLADASDNPAPNVEVIDPDGEPLDVAAAITSSPGDATLVVQDLVLPKTGTYQVVAKASRPGVSNFYTFTHKIRYAPMPDTKTHLSARAPRPVYVSAPRGGLVAITITPESGSDMRPDIQGVKDPWGGPALDRAQVPPGVNPPRVSHGADHSMTLTFVAPRPGVYTILAAAKPGAEGVGTLSLQVRPPKWRARDLYHDDAPAGSYGFPGGPPSPAPVRERAAPPTASVAPRAPAAAPAASAPAPAAPAPAPFPPPARQPPATQAPAPNPFAPAAPPLDPSIAQQ
jgi:hypothetical protein